MSLRFSNSPGAGGEGSIMKKGTGLPEKEFGVRESGGLGSMQ